MPRKRTVSSTTLGEARAERRRLSGGSGRPPRGGRAPLPRFLLPAVGVLLAIGVVFIIVYNLPIFKISKVVVSPTKHISSEMISGMTQVPQGATLFKVDTKAIEERFKENPWVQSIDIKRKFPSTLEISIVERTVGAIVVARSDEEAWYISTDGTWIQPIPIQELPHQEEKALDAEKDADSKDKKKDKDKGDSSKDKKKDSKSKDKKKDGENAEGEGTKNALADVAPEDSLKASAEAAVNLSYTVSGQARERAQAEKVLFVYNIDPQIVPEAGKKVPDSGLSGVLEYMRAFSPALRERVVRMAAPNKSSIIMMLDNGVQVALGAPASEEDIKLKESVLTNLLEQHQGEITYINVRVPTKPAWRGLEQKSKEAEKSKDAEKSKSSGKDKKKGDD